MPRDDKQSPITMHFKSGRGKLVRRARTVSLRTGELRLWKPSKRAGARINKIEKRS